MSLVEYSPELHDLITVSLHHFEDDTIREGFVHNETIPLVRVDPESRSAHFRIQSLFS
jgi:cleavage and polyadenylation specificity factor subunit 1